MKVAEKHKRGLPTLAGKPSPLCMKAIQFILFFVILVPLSAFSQSNELFYKELSAAMGSGNSRQLTQLFHEEIDITRNGSEGSYSREQAGAMFLQFFQENHPTNFNLKHKGASADGQVYMIGQLETRNGQQFKIVCRARSVQAGFKVFKLDVEGSY